MKGRKYIFLILAGAILIPGAALFATTGDYPTLMDIDFRTPEGLLVMELTFDKALSPADINVKRINYPSRFVVSVSPAAKSEAFREGVVYQDILSDGSRGVDNIEFYYNISHDKVGFITHPMEGLGISVTTGANGKVLVIYTRVELEDDSMLEDIHYLPPLEPAPEEEDKLEDWFTLDKAELHLSQEAESIIRAYFSNNSTEEADSFDAGELLASVEGLEAATGRHTGASYRIQVGDRLLMGVAGEPELELSVQVRPDGYVSFQIIGDVLVEGKTAADVRRTVKRLLQPYYNYDIVVDVIITEFTPQKVYLLGKIYDAGPHAYHPGMTLLDVFSNFDQRDADFTKVKLLRGDDAHLVDMEALLAGEVHMNYELEPGDYIVVPAKILPKAVVLGKVKFPSQYSFEEGSRLFDLVGIAGGFNDRCDIRNIRVLRLTDGAMLEFIKCDLRAYQEDGGLDQNILIENGDIIIVPEVGRPNWDKFFDAFSAVNSITLWGRTTW